MLTQDGWISFTVIYGKILKFNKKIKQGSNWVSSVKLCAFPIQGKCHFQSWVSWSLESPGQPLRTPHGSTSVPWLVLSNPQKTLCSWRRVSCTGEPFLGIFNSFWLKQAECSWSLIGCQMSQAAHAWGVHDQEMPS